MQEYTVTLANGQSYTITAGSPAEAARIANADAQEAGTQILNVAAVGSAAPITTALPGGTRVAFDAPPTPVGLSQSLVPTPILTSDGNLGRGSFSYADYFPGMEGREAEVTMGSRSVPVSQFDGVKEAIQYLQDDSVSDKEKEVFTRRFLTDVGPGGGDDGDKGKMVEDSTPNLPSLPDIPLEELDLRGAYQRALGLLDRSLTDPYRRYLEREYSTFLQPYRFGKAFMDETTMGFQPGAGQMEIDVPTFEDYVRGLGTPQAAREEARSVFSNVIGGDAPEAFQNLIGGPFRIDRATGRPSPDQLIGTRTFGMLDEPEQAFLGNLGDLGRRALRGRIGSAAYDLIGGLLPSVGDLYNQYYNEAQKGTLPSGSPTFGTYLQGAYGI